MHLNQIKKQCELFFNASMLPVCCFEDKNLLFLLRHPIQDYNLPLLLFDSLSQPLPQIWYSFTPEFIYFGGLKLPSTPYTLLLGPVLLSECSAAQASAICLRLGRKKSDFADIQRYFRASGARPAPNFLASLRLLSQLFGSKDPTDIPLLPFSWNLPYPSSYSSPQLDRTEEQALDLENYLLSCVRTGNLAALNQYMSKIIDGPKLHQGINLTSMRSYILGANLLASRTARLSGVDYALLNNIAGKYIEQILQARTTTDLTLLFFRCFQEYTSLVARLYELPSSSPIVRFIHQYITTHYSEKITPHSLAEQLHLNVSYLCTHFKKETGLTISSYVQREKIREAKRLLAGTKDSVAQISAFLGFSSQSYFCAIFKKITGRTPESYRLSL